MFVTCKNIHIEGKNEIEGVMDVRYVEFTDNSIFWIGYKIYRDCSWIQIFAFCILSFVNLNFEVTKTDGKWRKRPLGHYIDSLFFVLFFLFCLQTFKISSVEVIRVNEKRFRSSVALNGFCLERFCDDIWARSQHHSESPFDHQDNRIPYCHNIIS